MDLTSFLSRHLLSDEYDVLAHRWFIPIIEEIIEFSRQHDGPLIVGVNGSQGSGKSTFSDLLCYVANSGSDESHNENAISLSVDDFYFTSDERKALADKIHPLFEVRGVPGTHNIDLAIQTIRQLKEFSSHVLVPRFDKSIDDRAPKEQWDIVAKKPDIIVLEGWCLGAEAQADEDLIKPVNAIEEFEDIDLIWRRYINQQLQQVFPQLYSEVDIWLMLKAPSFDCVAEWRLEQEEKLKQSLARKGMDTSGLMSREEIVRFVELDKRVTQHTFNTLPNKVHYLFELDEHRQIQKLDKPLSLPELSN